MPDDPVDPRTCDHPAVAVQAHTDRKQLLDGSIGAFLLSISAHCERCGTSFWFPGMATGVSYREPVTNQDGFIATLPMVPNMKRNEPDASLAETKVRNNDMFKGRKSP